MANRVTIKDLEAVIRLLNAATKSPVQTWENGKSNIGNYHLYQAYGAYGLHRIANEGGGVHAIFGLTTKRELHGQVHAMLRGIGIGESL